MAANEEIDKACKEKSSLKSFTVPQLKTFLRSRGQYVSGNKKELIERVVGACKLGIQDCNSVEISDEDTETDKLKTVFGKVYKHPSYIDSWCDDVSIIPEVTDKDIYNYFVYKLGVKRQLKSKVMYDDGHVHKIQINDTDENDTHCFVRANIIPSMPSANIKQCPDYRGWVMLSKVTGCIHSAECTCVAGFNGEGCNHIAALLYAIADISNKRKDGLLAPTSIKCKWNNPRKRKLTPKKSQDLTFKKSIHGKDIPSVKRVLPVNTVETTVNIERIKEKLLKGNSNAGWLKNFQIDFEKMALPKLHNIQFNYHDKVNLQSPESQRMFETYFDSLHLTEEKCFYIESLTRRQSDSDYWFDARSERLTASNFGRICKMKADTKPDSVLKDILGYRTFESTHTLYGKKHEAAARRTYLKYVKEDHPGLTVKKCGLLTTSEFPYLGASPDGFVNCTHCQQSNGVLEIKCPSSLLWRMNTPQKCATDPKFFCFTSASGKVTLKRGHSYYFQVQGQLGLSGRAWCDFVVWTCMGISVERIFKDDKFFAEMVSNLKRFYLKAFIPELFSRRVERSKKQNVSNINVVKLDTLLKKCLLTTVLSVYFDVGFNVQHISLL